MRCQYCDRDLPERVPVCPFCGAPVEAFHKGTEWNLDKKILNDDKEGTTTKNTSEKTENNLLVESKMLAAKIAGLDMRWYHIMIFAVLFLMVFMYLGLAFYMFNGTYIHKELNTTLSNTQLYRSFPSLRICDIVSGFVYLGAAGYSLKTRQQLSKFEKNGPGSLSILLVAMMCFAFLRCEMVGMAVHSIHSVKFVMIVPNLLQSFVLLVINHFYFQKRKFLFDQ